MMLEDGAVWSPGTRSFQAALPRLANSSRLLDGRFSQMLLLREFP